MHQWVHKSVFQWRGTFARPIISTIHDSATSRGATVSHSVVEFRNVNLTTFHPLMEDGIASGSGHVVI